MLQKDIIVIGTSSGGLEALRLIVSLLPENFPGSIFVVMHTSPSGPGFLGEILDRAGPLTARNAVDMEQIRPGRIYVAPPDHHLLVERSVVRVTRGPKENRHRPAVDPLFRSAAYAYGARVTGIVLTGNLDDGTAGLWAIKHRGGTAIVQDPREALYPSMPQSALNHVAVDYCLPLAEIPALLVRLASASVEKEAVHPASKTMEIETRIALEDKAMEIGIMDLGELTPYTCPECHGTLSQLSEGGIPRFRCHTGHAFSLNSLLAEVTESIEDSLWSTLRGIEESIMLMRHLARHLNDTNHTHEAELFQRKADEAQQRADLIRRAVLEHEKPSADAIV